MSPLSHAQWCRYLRDQRLLDEAHKNCVGSSKCEAPERPHPEPVK